MESFLFQQQNQAFLLDCVYNCIINPNQNGDFSNISSYFTSYSNSSDGIQESSTCSLPTPQVSSEKKRKHSDDQSCLSTGQSKGAKESKSNKKKPNGVSKKKVEQKKPKTAELKATKAQKEEPPLGYIHVRARRGQATDSHSLAERVRRERISERMKKLQDLVPGCDKVIGKALVLDEIINYVQSLQNQVEFLSMKLTSVNPILYDFGGGFEDYTSQQEEMGSISHPMPSVIQNNHIQTTAIDGATDSLQQVMYGQGASAFSQDGGSILMQIGLNNTCSFQ